MAVSLYPGSILSSDFTKFSVLGESLPKYLFSIGSRLWIYGNFIPKNLGFFRKVSLWSEVRGPRHF